MNSSIVKFQYQPPAAFGSNEELNAIIERMSALIPVDLNKDQKEDTALSKALDNAYLKAAQLSVFYRLVPGIDVHIIRFGKSFSVDTGVEAWKKAADRYCSLHGIAYHAIYEALSIEELKSRRGKNYTPEDVGFACYIWRSDKAEVYKMFGDKEAITKGYGHWAKNARWNDFKKQWEEDQIPVQRTKQDVAKRRALKAALKMEFSLDSLLAAAPNEVAEQLKWLDSDANRVLQNTAPMERVSKVDEDGLYVITHPSTARISKATDSAGFAMVGEPLEQEEDNGHWEDIDEEREAAGGYEEGADVFDNEAIEEWGDLPPDNEEEQSSLFDPELVAEYRMLGEKLTESAATLRDWSKAKHADSQGPSSLVDYRILAGEIDKLIGKPNHNMLLGVLLAREVHSENRPGEKFVRFLLSFLRETLPQLNEDGSSIKDAKGRVIKNKNPQYSIKFVDAIKETWRQIKLEEPKPTN